MSQESAFHLEPGQRVSHYEILGRLGHGGMGVVYAARDLALGRQVALKRPHPEAATDPALRRRFLREVRVASQLSSPYIVPIFEAFEDGNLPWVAMAYVEGRSLRAVLRERGALSLAEVMRVGEEIGEALRVAHSHGVIHRDLSPNNVMISPEGRASLMDFGLALFYTPPEKVSSASTQSERITAGETVGTPGYMSPEQALGRTVDPRSDIFSLAAVLYETCTAAPAFSGAARGEVLDAILHQQPEPIWRQNYEIPQELDRIILKGLAKNPEERFQNVGDLLADLRALRRQTEYEEYGKEHVVSSPSSRGWRRRLPRRRALLTAAILAPIGILAALAWPWRDRVPGQVGFRNVSAQPVVTWGSWESEGRISPDREWVSFLSDRSGRDGIWVRKRSGGEAHEVATGEDPVTSHVWSPDGNEFACLLRKGTAVVLQVIPAPLGGQPRLNVKLEEASGSGTLVRLVRWLGSAIYVEFSGSLWRYLPATTRLEQVTPADGRFQRRMDFDVHADENEVVFVGMRDNQQRLWVMNLSRRTALPLSKAAADASAPLWVGNRAPSLFFISNPSDRTGIWEMDLDGGSTRQVPFGGTAARVDDVYADASLLLVQSVDESAHLWRLESKTGELLQQTSDSPSDFVPSWARLAPVVAFQRSKPEIGNAFNPIDSQIVAAAWGPRGLEQERLVVDQGASPSLASDGQWLAYLTKSSRPSYPTATELWVKDLNTQISKRLTDRFPLVAWFRSPAELAAHNVVWAHRQPRLFFAVAPSTGGMEIHIHDARSESPDSDLLARVTGRAWVFGLHLSGDDEQLAYVLATGDMSGEEVHVLDLKTRENRTLFAEPRPYKTRFYLGGWLGDQRSLLGLRLEWNSDLTQRMEVLEIPRTGPPRLIGVAERAFGATARLDPEGRLLYYTAAEGSIHNVFTMSMMDGSSRRLTRNEIPRVSFSGLLPLSEGDLIFSRQESNSDVWLIETTK